MQKQVVNINFAQGLDQKVDPFQLAVGKFIALDNIRQSKQGLLEKRPGNALLASLPDTTYSYLTTFKGNLTGISSNLAAYIAGQNDWIVTGSIQPIELDTLPLVRSNTTQSQADIAICTANNLICTVFTDSRVVGAVTTTYWYTIADATTGQVVVAPTYLVNLANLAITGSPKVYYFGGSFCILYLGNLGTFTRLFISTINVATLARNLDSTLPYVNLPAFSLDSFDAVATDTKLYIATGGNSVVTFFYLDTGFNIWTAPATFANTATKIGLTVDTTGASPLIYAAWIVSTTSAYVGAFDQHLNIVFGPTSITLPAAGLNVTLAAQNNSATLFFEISNNYGYDSSIASHYIRTMSVTSTGTVGTQSNFARSVGLASRPAILDGSLYLLVAFSSPYQPTYFLLNSSGNVVAKLAYSNGGGYLTLGLPHLLVTDSGSLYVPYLFKDLVQSVNKMTNVPAGSQVAGIYSQTGVNLAKLTPSTSQVTATEIGNNLNINGGFLWGYDGYLPVEQNFFLWPDSVEVGTSTGAGSIAASTYFYQVTYEWTDNQGNAYRSAPSIPVSQVTTTASSTNTISVPTLRLTYKIANPVKIVVYRWSLNQQSYYQITSITSPKINDPTQDFVTITDTFADSTILGNNLLYTTGGVVEDVNAPAATAMTLFDTRLWLIDAEDQNLLWFSKQVIEATPVEMSDLFTFYIAPSTGTGGSTGVMRCLAPMDDKLIIFKDQAIYYIAGTGPDNTGANNQYTQPIFITSTVGCNNARSIVLTPNGLMFQSDNGIWLLSRNLQTEYIGKDVQNYNSATVLSAINVPESNIVIFNLDSGISLTYNYFFGQWATDSGLSPVSSTSYQGLTTFIDKFGRTFQETPGLYLDGSAPVIMSLTTSWLNLTGLQGFQRAYYFYLLATFMSPHKLSIQIAYDYNASPTQGLIISPTNYSPAYGLGSLYGGDPTFGGLANREQWQVHLQRQQCQSLQITIKELYDPSVGVAAGAGFTMSGIDLVFGSKKGYPILRGANQIG